MAKKTIYITDKQLSEIKKRSKKTPSAMDQVDNKVNAGIMDAVTCCSMCEEKSVLKEEYDDAVMDIFEEYNAYSVLEEFLEDKKNGIDRKQWNLIPAQQYANLLRRYMASPEMAKIPYNVVNDWFLNVIVKNSMALDIITSLAGHTNYFPTDDYEEVFGEALDYDQASKKLEEMGFYAWAKLPDGSDAWSDYGLRPLGKVIQEYRSNLSGEEILILINRCLDIYHCRGDLASAFIEGGTSTCSSISLNENSNDKRVNAYIKQLFGITDFKQVRDKVMDIYKKIPTARYYDGKYLLGVIRYVYDEKISPTEYPILNYMIGHYLYNGRNTFGDKFDGNFNNLSYEELKKEIYPTYMKDPMEIKNAPKVRKVANGYIIRRIDNFPEAERYTDGEWCIGNDEDSFSSLLSESETVYIVENPMLIKKVKREKKKYEDKVWDAGEYEGDGGEDYTFPKQFFDDYALSRFVVISYDQGISSVYSRYNIPNCYDGDFLSNKQLEALVGMPVAEAFPNVNHGEEEMTKEGAEPENDKYMITGEGGNNEYFHVINESRDAFVLNGAKHTYEDEDVVTFISMKPSNKVFVADGNVRHEKLLSDLMYEKHAFGEKPNPRLALGDYHNSFACGCYWKTINVIAFFKTPIKNTDNDNLYNAVQALKEKGIEVDTVSLLVNYWDNTYTTDMFIPYCWFFNGALATWLPMLKDLKPVNDERTYFTMLTTKGEFIISRDGGTVYDVYEWKKKAKALNENPDGISFNSSIDGFLKYRDKDAIPFILLLCNDNFYVGKNGGTHTEIIDELVEKKEIDPIDYSHNPLGSFANEHNTGRYWVNSNVISCWAIPRNKQELDEFCSLIYNLEHALGIEIDRKTLYVDMWKRHGGGTCVIPYSWLFNGIWEDNMHNIRSVTPLKDKNAFTVYTYNGKWIITREGKILSEDEYLNTLNTKPAVASTLVSEGLSSKGYDFKKDIKSILKFMKDDGLKVSPFPEIKLNWEDQDGLFIRTGYYEPEAKRVVVFCKDRHPKDVLRSICHEMVHHIQNLEGKKLNFTSEDDVKDNKRLEEIESEAYLKGNIYFRKWTEHMRNKEMLQEGKKIVKNDEGKIVPEKCDKCGGDVVLQIHGEPVYLCKDCGKYFGTMPFPKNLNEEIEESLWNGNGEEWKLVNVENVPPVLYHVSPIKNRKSILYFGIQASVGQEYENWWNFDGPNGEIADEEIPNMVFLTDKPNTWRELFSKPYGVDLYIIDSSKLDRNKLFHDPSNYMKKVGCYCYADDIPVEAFVIKTRGMRLNENVLQELEPEEVDLTSFNIKHNLNPKFWKDGKLDSRIRIKLLDIADDFIETLNVNWVKPEDIIITGSLSNFNWNEKYSDIDLHILIDFSKVDKKTEFVKEYFDAKKKIWNDKHQDLKIYGFSVEVYVQDVNENHTSSGVYSLEKNEWLVEPKREPLASAKVNKEFIKKQVAKYATAVEALVKEYKECDGDEYCLRKIGEKARKIFDAIKNERKSGLSSGKCEITNNNIVFKALRRLGVLDVLTDIKVKTYDRLNSLNQ